jgi:hypothetical protein
MFLKGISTKQIRYHPSTTNGDPFQAVFRSDSRRWARYITSRRRYNLTEDNSMSSL